MKKIPTLFVRKFEGRKIIEVTPEITPGCEEAFLHGASTMKIDGSCCAIINGEFYKRYDAKKGKKPPEGAIPCCDPDPVTGHWPHWVKVKANDPSDKWFINAYLNTALDMSLVDGTYEAIGPHFQGNPYNRPEDVLVKHGVIQVPIERNFEAIRDFFANGAKMEGIVFWLNGEPICKIKRTDFGLDWPLKEK